MLHYVTNTDAGTEMTLRNYGEVQAEKPLEAQEVSLGHADRWSSPRIVGSTLSQRLDHHEPSWLKG